MIGNDIVEPTDHLYQEGNVIGKHNNNARKKRPYKRNQNEQNKKEQKIHKYQKEDLGHIIDIEV